MTNTALSAGAIRIVLADIPGLTAGMVERCVSDQPDIVIVEGLHDLEDLAALAHEHTIDVVITACTLAGVSNSCEQLLFGEAAIPVIAIATDGRLEIYDRRVLREAGPNELLAEIRRVASRRVEQSRA